MGYAIRTRGLCVGYDGVPAARDVSLEIEQGEIVTLIGPNGAGKSTILKGVARQLKPLAGVVELGGEDLFALPATQVARRMAVVLTDRARPELLTCRDVAAMGRYPYTGRLGVLSREDEAQVDAAMAAVRALDIAQRDFGAISDGQRQRVLLARALCQQPEVILLDEPTSYLDVRHKLEILQILRRLAREQGIAVIMSLHEIELAQRVSDRVVCVRDGMVTRFGAPEQIFTEPTIRELYDLAPGAFDPISGGVELPGAAGAPQAFVLSNGGTGAPVYRRLRRLGTPFAAGILHENDADCHLARQLAVEVVTERPFCEVSEAALGRALELVRAVPRVIDAGVTVGPGNRRVLKVIEAAKSTGIYERVSP